MSVIKFAFAVLCSTYRNQAKHQKVFIIMYSDAHDDIIDFKYVSELEKTRNVS